MQRGTDNSMSVEQSLTYLDFLPRSYFGVPKASITSFIRSLIGSLLGQRLSHSPQAAQRSALWLSPHHL